MKTRFLSFLLAAVVAAGFLSCKMEGYSDSTPKVSIISKAKLRFAGIKADSTMGIKMTSDYAAYAFDSLCVGDTVSFFVRATGYPNALKEFFVTSNDASAVELMVPDSIKYFFSTASDFASGKMYLAGNTAILIFPVKFTLHKPKETLIYSIYTSSDASKVMNTARIDIKFPIKPKRK